MPISYNISLLGAGKMCQACQQAQNPADQITAMDNMMSYLLNVADRVTEEVEWDNKDSEKGGEVFVTLATMAAMLCHSCDRSSPQVYGLIQTNYVDYNKQLRERREEAKKRAKGKGDKVVALFHE